ncbi:NACHT domain-containing protein [Streptomyces sp. Lzd4kr]|nr:NACHT domain-containing protein [Streptomyces sp. Lzd4kr]
MGDLLGRCTVEIFTQKFVFVGSGFFVLPNTVLTCAHVLANAGPDPVVVWGEGQITTTDVMLEPNSDTTGESSYEFPDLGVVYLAGVPDHPCVWLSDENPCGGKTLYARGFSAKTLQEGIRQDGLRVQVVGPSGDFVRVSEDRIIPGLSGSPALDPCTGRIHGIVKATRHPGDSQGGWIVPAVAFKSFVSQIYEANMEWNRENHVWPMLIDDRQAQHSEAIDGILQAQKRALSEMPYPMFGLRNPTLPEVYIPQKLNKPSSPDREDQEVDDSWIPPTQESSRSVRQALLEDENILLVGGAGQGKSTLTLWLASELASEWESGEYLREPIPGKSTTAKPLLPIRVSARLLSTNRDLSWLQALARASSTGLGLHQDSALPAELPVPPTGAQWLVIIDAVDEIIDPRARHQFINSIAQRASEPVSDFRFLITTRPLAQSEMVRLQSGAALYTTEPFDTGDLRLFSHQWFLASTEPDADDLGNRFIEQLSRTGMHEISTVPLLLTMAAVIFEQHPDRQLPSHRQDLYSQYIATLMQARSTPEEWENLKRSLATSPHSSQLVDLLYSRRAALASHLAVIAASSDRKLLPEAIEWTRNEAAGLEIPMATSEWKEVVATTAVSTGLMVRQGNDLTFLQTFAEFLASKEYASHLPGVFDHKMPQWRHWIDEAVNNASDLARLVLVHHTQMYGGNSLFSWLQQAPYLYRILAGELLAQGACAPPGAVEDFLIDLKDGAAWRGGRATRESAFTRSLSAASALIDEPKVPQALEEIVNSRISMSKRIRSAHVLALGGLQSRQKAIQSMRSICDQGGVSPFSVAVAARALADLDSNLNNEAAEKLISLLKARKGDNSCLVVVPILAELGNYREEGIEALRAVIRNSHSPLVDRAMAAKVMAGLDAEYHEEALNILTAVLANPTVKTPVCRLVSETIVALDPKIRPESSRRLQSILSSPQTLLFAGRWAAKTLSEIDPDCREVAAGALRDSLASVHDSPSYLWVIRVFASLGEGYREEAAELTRNLLQVDRLIGNFNTPAARMLAELGTEYYGEAAAALRNIVATPTASYNVRWSAVRALSEIGQYHDEGMASLRDLLRQVPSIASFRFLPVDILSELDPDYHEEVADDLRAVIVESATDTGKKNRPMDLVRVEWASRALAQLGSDYRDEAAGWIRDILDTVRHREPRIALAKLLADSGPNDFTEAVQVLQDVCQDPRTRPATLSRAARLLIELDPRLASEATRIFLAVIQLRSASPETRFQAAQALIYFCPQSRQEVLRAISEMIGDAKVQKPVRDKLERLRVRLNPRHGRHTVRAAAASAEDPPGLQEGDT